MTADNDGVLAYETCAIVFSKNDKTGRLVFWAKATGNDGTYTVAESQPLVQNETGTYLGSESHLPLSRLMADLVGRGWEFLGTYGSYFWEHRLRRRLTAQGAAGELRAGIGNLGSS